MSGRYLRSDGAMAVTDDDGHVTHLVVDVVDVRAHWSSTVGGIEPDPRTAPAGES